ncbi:type II secretion system protein [Kaarinaea lacus]
MIKLSHYSKRQFGFTLIEMVLVIMILGILAGITAPIFSQGLTASRLTTENLHTLEKLRYATERLAREIRQIDYDGTSYDVSSMSAANFSFVKTDSSSGTVSINYTGATLQLSYSTLPATAVLTDEVSGFNLAYYDADGVVTASSASLAFVEITLTLQNPTTTASYSQRTRVALRDRS